MKAKSKSALKVEGRTAVEALCLGTILLLTAAGARGQDLFVSSYGSGQITEITPSAVQSTFASGLNQPLGLAFDRAGNLYEADASSGHIYKFAPDGTQSTFASGLSRPVGLAFNSAGNLYVADAAVGQIVQITAGGAATVFASGLNLPLGLAIDSGDNLFVADGGSGNIYEFTSAGVQSTFASGLNTPFGLAFDSAGILYEADEASGIINKYTPAGVQSTFASGLNLPVGLAFNNAGDLFVGEFGGGNIYEFNAAGARSTFAAGLDHPTFLAFPLGALITLNCPADIVTNNNPGECSAIVAFAADATGSPAPSVIYTLGGSVITSPFPFPVGTNVVTCIASNAAGSTACDFTVLVRDIVPPMIDCPSNIVVDALSSSGTVVNFSVTASDECAPSPQVTCVPPSGSLFPLGSTTVMCTVVDAWGNSNTCSFVVSVVPSQVQALFLNLITYLAGLPIQHGVKNALLVKLTNSLSELQEGQIDYALDLLAAFNHQVSAQTGKKLTLTQAAALTSGANAIIAALSGETTVVAGKASRY